MNSLNRYDQKAKCGYIKVPINKLLNRVIVLIMITALLTETVVRPDVFSFGYSKAFAMEMNEEQDTSGNQEISTESHTSDHEADVSMANDESGAGIILPKDIVTEERLSSESVPEMLPDIDSELDSEPDSEQTPKPDYTSATDAPINEVTPAPEDTETSDGTEEQEQMEQGDTQASDGTDESEQPVPEGTPIMELDTEAPSAPVNLVATVTGSAIMLSWKSSSDNVKVIGYDINQEGVPIGFAEANLYVVPDAVIGMTYHFSVSARDEAGNVSVAAEAIFTMPSDERPAITTAKAGEAEVSLEWSQIAWATGYEISINGEIIDIGNVTVYTHTSVLSNTLYEYRIRALNGPYIGEWSDSTSVLTAPGKVTNLLSKVIDSKSIKLSWEVVEGALSYEIEANGKSVGTTAENTYTHSNTNPARNNTYRVRALNGDLTGAWSDAAVNDKVTYINGGIISQNTVWGGGTYVVQGSITVAQGVTLQVMPGTIVTGAGYYAYIKVSGKILAQGTAESPIVFTSSRDPEYGGSGVTVDDDYWRGIDVEDTGEFIGNYVKLKYGGHYSYRSSMFSILNVKGVLYLSNSEVSSSYQCGINIESGLNVTIQDCIIEKSGNDNIQISKTASTGTITIKDNIIQNTLGDSSCDGIDIYRAGGVLTVEGNTIRNCCGYPINIDLSGITSSSVISGISMDNIFSGNQKSDYILIRGITTADLLLTTNRYTTDFMVISNGKSLTVQPGTVILGAEYDSYISVSGNLLAQGTADNPIVFTTAKDPEYGGNGVEWQRDAWIGLEVSSSGTFSGDHLKIKNAGSHYMSKYASITIKGALNLSNSQIINSYGCGIYINSGENISILNSTIDGSVYDNINIDDDNATGTVTMKDCIISDSSENGIEVHENGQNGLIIENNIIKDNKMSGIHIDGYGSGASSIKNNTITNNGGYPIKFNLSYIKSSSIFENISPNTCYGNKVSNYMYISGSINNDIILSANTYVMGWITQYAGTTLTLQPGTVMLGEPSYGCIDGGGAIIARGTEEEPIIFSSLMDPEYGGTGVSVRSDTWRGINVESTGAFTGDNVKFKYVGYSYYESESAALVVEGEMHLSNSEIIGSYKYGIDIASKNEVSVSKTRIDSSKHSGIIIHGSSGLVTIKDSLIKNGLSQGIYISDSEETINIENNTIDGNAFDGIYVSYLNNGNLIIKGNDIVNNGYYPISFSLSNVYGIESFSGITDNIFKNNKKSDAIELNGSLKTDITLSPNTYYFDYINVPTGIVLTINAGTVILAEDLGSYINVSGKLLIHGMKDNPAVMTSSFDSDFGGAGVISYTRYWKGIRVQSTGIMEAAYLKLNYGSTSICVYGSVALVNSEIINSYNYGIYNYSTVAPTLLYNTFKNDAYGVYNANSNTTIDASFNYWDSIYGPSVYVQVYDPTRNTWTNQWIGNGTKIYGNVIYTPYLGSEMTMALHYGKTQGAYAPTGNYSRQFTDMSLKCLEGTLDFIRTYNSQDTKATGILGKGWTFNYEACITDYEGFENIKLVRLPDGSQEAFTVGKNGSFTANNTRSVLEKLADGSYLLTTREQIRYGFNPKGNLTRIESREGNQLTILLTPDGKPLSITDYAGREYQLTYQGGLLKSIIDPAGRKVTYGYESGRLVKVTGPEDITTYYGYDTEGYLSEVRDENNDRIEAITYQTTGKTTRVNQVTDAYGNRKNYTYDDVNGKTTITDSKGVTTTQWYDTTYNITNFSDGEGRLTTAVYTTQDGVNKYGEVKSATDRNGNTTSYEYDSRGNTIRITNPDSSYRQYTYNGKNRITSEREEAGKFTYYIYDETDTLLLKAVRPLDGTDVYSEAADQSKFAITNYSYYAPGERGYTIRGLVKSITDPEGNITAYTYDAYGNVATVTNPEGNKTTYTNNILGLPTVILSPKGEKTTISYNDNADPVKEVKDGQETTQMFYDNLGRKIQELTPNLSRMISEPTGSEGYRYTYYPSGSLQSVTDPEDNTTTYTYDLYGNIQTETRPDGSIQCYEYDTLNRVIKEYFQDSKTSERSLQKSYAYSILSNKNTQTTETVYLNLTETAVTVKVYDYAGRQTKQTNPDGGITGAVYNSNGTLYSATDAMDKLTYYRYDGLNRITQQWTPFENGKYTYSAYTYDKNGNKLTESIGIEAVSQWGIPATLLTTVYEYDGNNLVTKAIDAAGGTTSYEYDANGNLSREIADMNGMISHETAYQHNHLGKVETETRYAKAGDIYGNAAGSTAETLLETVHTYDANGNVLTVTTPDGITTAYEYDKLDRPVAQTVQGLDEYGHPADITTSMVYDYAGNILSTTDANGNTTRNTYNAKGLLIRSVDAEGGITLHEYDNAGRRTATITPENYVEGTDVNGMSRAVFTYDTMGRIILEQDIYYDKTAGAWNTINAKAYRYDKNGSILKELDALGYESSAGSTIADRINNGYGTVNTYNDAGLLLSTQSPVSKEKGISYDFRYTYDAAGRKITETNAKGVVTTHTYDNMGRVLKTSVQNGTAKTLRQVTYDRLGNILTETDGKGNTTTYIYNRLGLVKSKTTPGDATIPSNMTVYQYDKLGRQVHQEDDLNKEIIITYNHNGQILTQTEQREDATQRITISNDYDKNGNLRFATDANGVTTEQTFDRLNRVVRTSLTVGGIEQATTYTYDKNGNQLTTTDWLGNTYTNEYDTLNRLVKKSDPYGAVIERYEYNNNHVQVKAIDALDNETTFAYDRNNRLLRTTDPEGNITSQTYDAVGNTATKTDGRGKATAYEYDALNRLVKVTNAKGEITAYTYDINGNMLTKKDGKNNTVTYTYNVANLLVAETDPAGVKESYVYYADGKVRSKTDKLGSILTYTYDIHGNLLTEAADGPGSMGVLEYNYTYDANGNMLTMTDSTGTTRRTYDELGRVLTKTVPVIGTVSFTYDIRTGAGEGCHRERTKDPKGNITIKEYDKTGRLIKVIAGSDTVTYTYYANGSRESVTYNDGTKEEYTYNANSQIETLINRRADGSILDSYTYTYDAAGNQLTKHEIITGVEKGTTVYIYDELNRLITATEPIGRSTSYKYDKVGNRTKETVTATNTAGSSITTVNTYTYDPRNRLTELAAKVNNVLTKVTGYIYDNNGNQLTTVVRSYANGTNVTSTITTLTNAYDLHNQLILSVTENGTTINNSYNAEGYRVGKEVITGEGVREYTRFLYESDKVILETTETGDLKARNIYGTNLLMRIAGSTAYLYLYNGHADVTALITSEGTIAATYYYDAFGNILESTGNVDNNILYAGYQYDIETGLYYLNTRMYDPVTARFLQEDSYKGDPKDPLSLNLYAYCLNNPIRYIDPTGHYPIYDDDTIKTKDPKKKGKESNDESEGTGNAANTGYYIMLPSGNYVEVPDYPYIGPEAAFVLGLDSNSGGLIIGGYNIISWLTGNQQITQDVIDFNKKHTYEFKDRYKTGQAVAVELIFGSIIGAALKPKGTSNTEAAGGKNPEIEGAGNGINTSTILDSASAAKKGGETVAGHALQKHAGRNPDIWGKVSGNSANINKTAMQHIDDIISGRGEFKTVQTNGISFLEKMLPDGRGIRLNMDGTFKGFIDQVR